MLRKLNFKSKIGLAAALMFAGLSGPASAQTNQPDPECMQFLRNSYCPAYWQSQHFASQEACVQYWTEACYYPYPYYVERSVEAPATVRQG